MPPVVRFAYSPDRGSRFIHKITWPGYSGVLQADAYGGYRALDESGRITEAACMAHARRNSMMRTQERPPTSPRKPSGIGELYAIEAEVRAVQQNSVWRQEKPEPRHRRVDRMTGYSNR
ncbi:IS66 family transposase [Escherichia coli]